MPCFLNQNIEWETRSQHVAITQDGIRYVSEKHPTLCGFSQTDKGKESKTIPFDKITDCDVQEPAGTAFFCCIENVLTEVTVDTASSGGEGGNEVSLVGLMHPHAFKTTVWAMKRSQGGLSAPSQAMMGGADAAGTKLLTEIRDELKKMNALMEAKSS